MRPPTTWRTDGITQGSQSELAQASVRQPLLVASCLELHSLPHDASSTTLLDFGTAPAEPAGRRNQLPRPNLWRFAHHIHVRRPRINLVRPNVPGTMRAVLADHHEVNATIAVTSPKLACQLDHAAPNQSEETRGFQLLRHRDPVCSSQRRS